MRKYQSQKPIPKKLKKKHLHKRVIKTFASVAELADAPGLGPGGLWPVEVRILSLALVTRLGLDKFKDVIGWQRN